MLKPWNKNNNQNTENTQQPKNPYQPQNPVYTEQNPYYQPPQQQVQQPQPQYQPQQQVQQPQPQYQPQNTQYTQQNTQPQPQNANIQYNSAAAITAERPVYSKTYEAPTSKDPEGIIPDSIYRIYKGQKGSKIFTIFVATVLLAGLIVLMVLFGFKPEYFNIKEVPWIWYVLVAIAIVLIGWKWISDIIELNSLQRSIKDYRAALVRRDKTVPAFIGILYRKLSLRQILQNWITIAITFYFGLFTLIFWALKDAQLVETKGLVHPDGSKAYILDFKNWILQSFPNPMNWVYIFCGIILAVILVHIIFTIIRKVRLTSIRDSYGLENAVIQQVQEEKTKQNRFYAKIFFISILVLLVLPFIIYIIAKKIISRKKG